MYQISDTIVKGNLISKAQYDRIREQVKTAKQYREEILQNITKENKLVILKEIKKHIVIIDIK